MSNRRGKGLGIADCRLLIADVALEIAECRLPIGDLAFRLFLAMD
jgi:hypothetical protein